MRKDIFKIRFKFQAGQIFLILASLIFSCKLKQKAEIQSIKLENESQKVVINKGNSFQKIIPKKVIEIREYIKINGVAKEGFVGGRKFKNLENILPKFDENGNKIFYQEWDVNPIKKGKNRGKERLITSSNGKAYFTRDHYKSFQILE